MRTISEINYCKCHAAPPSCFKSTQKLHLTLCCWVLQRQNKKVAMSHECLCGCVYVPVSACIYVYFCVNSWKSTWSFTGRKVEAKLRLILSYWVAILHVVMRLIGPSSICSGSLPSPWLLELTIILPNLACVTAEDKCVMPSPPAARETLSHFKSQSMPFNTPKRFNIDRLDNIDGFIWLRGRQIQKNECFKLSVYTTN